MELYQTQPDRKLRAKALAKEFGTGGNSHDYLDGSSGFVTHDWRGLQFEHYPDHGKTLLRWNQVEQYIDLMIQSDRYLTENEKTLRAAVQEAERQLPMLDDAAATEYSALKALYRNTLVGFELGSFYLFYGEDAHTVSRLLNNRLITQENALGKVNVSGFASERWASEAQKLWAEGHSVYLAGMNEDDTHHHQTKFLREEDYLPLGTRIQLDGREFIVQHVNSVLHSVTLQDAEMLYNGHPALREEYLPRIRELYEEQQLNAPIAVQEVFPDYNVDDHVVVDLPTQTIEGTVGYVGDTDVRIDPDDGYSWEHEVINKQQFEDGLRQDEPETEAPAQDEPEQLEENAPEPAGNFRITDDDLGAGGPKQKYARNIEAIRTLFTLEQEHRGATAEEQQVLSQYVGWGGLADVFDSSKENWASEYAELKGLLSETEYAAARESTLNAHFTSPVVIRAIYDAVERMGFHGGNILEPSMGVGNFFGMLPESMADSRLYGVELDSITGRIAKMLYP